MKNKEYKILDYNKYLSYNQLEKAILTNCKTIIMLENEVTTLKKLNMNLKKSSQSEENTVIENNKIEIEENPLLDEINYYLSLINQIDFINSNDLTNEILLSLPSIKNGNFQTIIYGINAYILKYINEIKKFIEEEKSNLSKEELQDFKNDILENYKKIKLINQVILSPINLDKQQVSMEHKNKIVFMETTNGNIYAIEDLDDKKIPKDYHESFYELFTSIEDGIFKNVKRFDSNNTGVSGMSEVKNHKTRIVFDRIGFDTYVVIAVFMKKSDNDKGYLNFLEHRVSLYRKQKQQLIEKIKNPEFMLEQQEILKQIYEKINRIETNEKGAK